MGNHLEGDIYVIDPNTGIVTLNLDQFFIPLGNKNNIAIRTKDDQGNDASFEINLDVETLRLDFQFPRGTYVSTDIAIKDIYDALNGKQNKLMLNVQEQSKELSVQYKDKDQLRRPK